MKKADICFDKVAMRQDDLKTHFFFWNKKYLNFAAQIKYYSRAITIAKNKGNAELRIDGDLYPRAF